MHQQCKQQAVLETIKSLKKEAVTIPKLVDEDHNEAIEDVDKINIIILSSFFSKCFNTTQAPLSDFEVLQLTTNEADIQDNIDTLLCPTVTSEN